MANTMNSSTNAVVRDAVAESIAPSDFIDFYQLLDAPADATTTHLRRRINDLYSEAQSNRDHRNAAKRRQYEALCELLPYCRQVLLTPDKRARYDEYRGQVASGAANIPSFESLMSELATSGIEIADDSGERVSLPGIEDDDVYLPASSPPVSNQTSKKSASRQTSASIASQPSAAEQVTLAGAAGRTRTLSKTARDSLIGSATSVLVFTAIFVVGWLVFHDMSWAVFLAAIAGVITWIVAHRKAVADAASSERNRVS